MRFYTFAATVMWAIASVAMARGAELAAATPLLVGAVVSALVGIAEAVDR